MLFAVYRLEASEPVYVIVLPDESVVRKKNCPSSLVVPSLADRLLDERAPDAMDVGVVPPMPPPIEEPSLVAVKVSEVGVAASEEAEVDDEISPEVCGRGSEEASEEKTSETEDGAREEGA